MSPAIQGIWIVVSVLVPPEYTTATPAKIPVQAPSVFKFQFQVRVQARAEKRIITQPVNPVQALFDGGEICVLQTIPGRSPEVSMA